MTDHLPTAGAGCESVCNPTGFDRREFLFASGATLVALALPSVSAAPVKARVARYQRKIIGKLGQLRAGQPVEFRYPWDHINCASVLLRLDQEAAGGIGPGKNVVAFNGLCPHMGWNIPTRAFHSTPGMAGPCPGHLTTFDLTRYGMVVSGHATQGLPQVMLELEGDDIVAVGMQGLVFGFHDNTDQPVA